MLEPEMDEHLGCEKHDIANNNSGNSSNGFGKKTVKTEWTKMSHLETIASHAA